MQGIVTERSLDKRIVLWGMSCSGKTTFAQLLKGYQYFCFDALFRWHEIETFGLSARDNLCAIAEDLKSRDCCVLDGWHLSDEAMKYIPEEVAIYVIYCEYQKVIEQYRISVDFPEQHLNMFRRWYCASGLTQRQGVRYFFNDGDFYEKSLDHFLLTKRSSLEYNR